MIFDIISWKVVKSHSVVSYVAVAFIHATAMKLILCASSFLFPATANFLVTSSLSLSIAFFSFLFFKKKKKKRKIIYLAFSGQLIVKETTGEEGRQGCDMHQRSTQQRLESKLEMEPTQTHTHTHTHTYKEQDS